MPPNEILHAGNVVPCQGDEFLGGGFVCQKNTKPKTQIPKKEVGSRGGFIFCKSCFFSPTLEYFPDDFRGKFPGTSWISGLVNAASSLADQNS